MRGQCRVGAGNAEFQFAGVFRARGRDWIVSSTFQTLSRNVARALECPPVPKCTRLVPAKDRDRANTGNITYPFAGLLCKPSDGLEPSTPSLPSERQPVATEGKGFRLFLRVFAPLDLPLIATGCAPGAP